MCVQVFISELAWRGCEKLIDTSMALWQKLICSKKLYFLFSVDMSYLNGVL
jgi:hypothetical protein